MAKAVLVMDMPEQVCQKCTLCYETENDDEYLCCATGKLVPDGAKPDWCPLRELPEKIPELKSGYEEISKSIHRDGWNACFGKVTNDITIYHFYRQIIIDTFKAVKILFTDTKRPSFWFPPSSFTFCKKIIHS